LADAPVNLVVCHDHGEQGLHPCDRAHPAQTPLDGDAWWDEIKGNDCTDIIAVSFGENNDSIMKE
jgi:hypothetical protein